ncbi:MAG: hypothetical protein HDT28_03980 [Clostridiales bacterium]|nr:hypothetical protein [Clostridiales bacterium]
MVSLSLLGLDTYTIVFVVLLVVLILALLVVPMFTNKKRAKQTEELHRSLHPGDRIKTVGGIIGTIKEIRQVSPVDKEMVIETGEGDNKTTMVLDIQALYQVLSRSNTSIPVAEEAPVEEKVEETVVANIPEKAEETPVATEETVADAPVPAAENTATESVEEKVEEPVAEQAAAVEPAEKVEEQADKPAAKKPAAKKPVNSAKSTGGAKKTTAAKTTKK